MILQDSKTYIEDLDTAIKHTVGIEKLAGTSILLTGATGTIGSFAADMLLRYNQLNQAGIKVCLAGRNVEKLKKQFGYWNDPDITMLSYDMSENITFDIVADYVIHAAGNAHPAAFNGDPVGTIIGNIDSTFRLLQYARTHGGKRLLYVSSGEVYGQGNLSLDEFQEDYAGYLDTSSARSCYPQSKRSAENLCASFSSQYGLETVVVRPCHTYGPGITETDNRANVQFIRNVLNNEDIVMKSAGTQMRSYNYIADCASGLFTILINGKSGEAYNTANPDVRITIARLAGIIADAAGRKVVFADPSALDLANRTPIAKQVLSTRKLESLGWCGAYTAELGIRHTLDILQGN